MSELINKIRQPTVPLEEQDVSGEKMTEAMKRITVIASIDELRTLRDAIDKRMTASVHRNIRDQLGYLKLMVGDRISAKDPLYTTSVRDAAKTVPRLADSGMKSVYRGMAGNETGMGAARVLGLGAMATGIFVWIKNLMRLKGKAKPTEEVLDVLPVEEKPKPKKERRKKKEKAPEVKREDLITDRD
ncbi:MAG: hypothetical protein G01um101425_714 [Candidatus Peregrinibacteria bacterium Gr01-1014_25]|nr:MAG: hypothetical protein G01um101425_714 [Candidatus Peregrinibacteria bacterium Gr01-1014_25]